MKSTLIFSTVLSVLLTESLAYRDIQPRIVGGHNAEPHEFPYLVSIANSADNSHNCGGTIISDRWILTAAHCLYGYKLDDFVVRAGKHNLKLNEHEEQIRYPVRYVIHADFNPNFIGPDDVGLIKVDHRFKFNKSVQPIDALPRKHLIPTGQGIVSGWGSTSTTFDYQEPEVLQTLEVQILPNDLCAAKLPEVNYTERHLCTGPITGQVGHCNGDSGGPLVQKLKNGKSTIIGIVTFSWHPCGTVNKPPAFASVSFYIGWITKNTGLDLDLQYLD